MIKKINKERKAKKMKKKKKNLKYMYLFGMKKEESVINKEI